jgi:hypothetical protein
MMPVSTRAEAADELRGQAASCRRLALTARTQSGSDALRTVAHQFDADAGQIDPVIIDSVKNGDAASLVRVQLALERQTMQWLSPRSAR